MQTIYLAWGKWWGVLKNTFIQGHVYLVISIRGVVKIIWAWGWRLRDSESHEALIRLERTVIICIDVWNLLLRGERRESGTVFSRWRSGDMTSHVQHERSALPDWAITRFLQHGPDSRVHAPHPRSRVQVPHPRISFTHITVAHSVKRNVHERQLLYVWRVFKMH